MKCYYNLRSIYLKKAILFILVLFLTSCGEEKNLIFENIKGCLQDDISVTSSDKSISFDLVDDYIIITSPPPLEGTEIFFENSRMTAVKFGYEINLPNSFFHSIYQLYSAILNIRNDTNYSIKNQEIAVENCVFSNSNNEILAKVKNKEYIIKRRTENGTHSSDS